MSESSVPAFHVMAKPTGARCNLRCDYCFFLEKDALYPGSDFRMSDEVMRAYIAQTAQAQRVPQVTLAWQGGWREGRPRLADPASRDDHRRCERRGLDHQPLHRHIAPTRSR